MSTVLAWVGGITALVIAVVLTRPLGRRLKGAAGWAKGLAAVAVLAVSLAIVVAASLLQNDLMWGIGIGFGFGGLTGLRHGWSSQFPSSISGPTNGDSDR